MNLKRDLSDLTKTTFVAGSSIVGITLTVAFAGLLAFPFYLTRKYSSDDYLRYKDNLGNIDSYYQ